MVAPNRAVSSGTERAVPRVNGQSNGPLIPSNRPQGTSHRQKTKAKEIPEGEKAPEQMNPSASFAYKQVLALYSALSNLPPSFLHCPSFLRLKTSLPKTVTASPRWSPSRSCYRRTNTGASPACRLTTSRQKESHSPKIYFVE